MTAADTATPPPRHRLRSILGGSAGNLVEWYDWYAYSAFTLYFAPHFFPKGDQTAQLLNAAAVFAVGFLMRPVGGWLMGIYGDRYGRKAGLTLSVTLMCAGSLLIAVTPGYATIGVAAPALLVLARLMQGISVGGEYGASATYLSEMAGKRHRGFWSSFQYVTLISGQLVALLVLLVLQSMLSEAALDAWGWRIPFLIGGVLAVIVFWLRRRLAETESFEKRGGGQSSIFAQDIDVALRAANRLEASAVMINDPTSFRVDWMPFAGRRVSGYGTGGIPYTMHDMTQDKMILLKRP